MRRRTVLIVAAAALGALLLWRLCPRAFSSVIAAEESAVTGISAVAMAQRLENGEPRMETWRISASETQKEELLAILRSSGYRPDLRNLLPGNVDAVDADRNYDGNTVRLHFDLGDGEDGGVSVQFLSPGIVAVLAGDENGFRVYHPADRDVMYALLEYVQTHGTKD